MCQIKLEIIIKIIKNTKKYIKKQKNIVREKIRLIIEFHKSNMKFESLVEFKNGIDCN
jgi:hypothetical protein